MSLQRDNVHPGIAALKAYQPGKPIDELTRELGITDIVKLASNENPRGPSDKVRAAISGQLDDVSRYPDGGGFALKQALSGKLQVAPEQLTLGNGSNDVLDLVARVVVAPGTEAIMAEHSFVVYRIATICAGGTVVQVPAKAFGTDLPAMLEAVTDNTRVVFIANPNNPTGTWVNNGQLVEFLEALPSHVWVVVDEAYFEYAESSDYPNAIKLLDAYPNLIVTRTFSKAFGLAGLRVGYSVSHPDFSDLLNRARQPFNVNSVAMAAAIAALGDEDYLTSSRAMNAQGVEQVTSGLDGLGLSHIPTLGNFVTFDCGRAGRDVYDSLLREGVIVRPVAEYGLPQHLRVSIGLPDENSRFLAALTQVLS